MTFFGDSASDHRTACDFGMEFVYVAGVREWEGPPPEDPITRSRICEFHEVLLYDGWVRSRVLEGEE
ncbi:hypothetical protein ACGF5M_02830 [Gemmatimonadota bacterium]